jgi:hypothetical protein
VAGCSRLGELSVARPFCFDTCGRANASIYSMNFRHMPASIALKGFSASHLQPLQLIMLSDWVGQVEPHHLR